MVRKTPSVRWDHLAHFAARRTVPLKWVNGIHKADTIIQPFRHKFCKLKRGVPPNPKAQKVKSREGSRPSFRSRLGVQKSRWLQRCWEACIVALAPPPNKHHEWREHSDQPWVCLTMFSSCRQHGQTAGIYSQILSGKKKKKWAVPSFSDWEICKTGETYCWVTCRKCWVFKCLARNFHEDPNVNLCNLDIWFQFKTMPVASHMRCIALNYSRESDSCVFDIIMCFVNEHL